jgi:hypothetical protein
LAPHDFRLIGSLSDLPLPPLERFGQHLPKFQFQVKPLAAHTVPKGNGISGRGKFGG